MFRSAFLLKAAALSGIRTLAVTGVSPTMPQQDFLDAREAEQGKGERGQGVGDSKGSRVRGFE